MGYGEGISEEVIDSLLANKTWGADYIEYWQELIHRFDGNPVAIVETLAWRSFAGDLVGRYLDLYEFGGANTELNIDRVSDVGPLLYLGRSRFWPPIAWCPLSSSSYAGFSPPTLFWAQKKQSHLLALHFQRSV